MPGRNHTTVPDSTARSTLRPDAVLAVRWLFPAPNGPLTTVIPLGKRAVVGRGDDCQTVLAGSGISRYHAELTRLGPVAMVRDLDSMNGMFVNGRRIKEAPLERGDVLRVGEWVGVVAELLVNEDAPAVYGAIAPGLIGGDSLRVAVEPALRVARSDLPIIIEGETGTGKEVVARAVHEASGRTGAFLAVNCAALPEQLAEAELFGYRRGAFTGADRPSQGHFRTAHQGTLLLDEASDLSLSLQAKVLRVLEQREVMPLGESQAVPIDVRVIVASQESLEKAIADKRFRPDLYARLEGLSVRLPPLRDRIDDVPSLFARLLKDIPGGTPPAVEPRLVEALCVYDWPFNVRELVTLVRRMLVLHGHEPQLGRRHLPARFRIDDAAGDAARPGRLGTMTPVQSPSLEAAGKAVGGGDRDEEDFARLLVALRSQGGNVSRAAGAIGISRQRAYRLMQARPEVDLPGLRGSG